MKNSWVSTTIALSICLGLLSCQKKTDADTIAEAQACLDSATSSTVNSCLTIVEGLTTEAAYLIRCSASFIYQDFTSPAKLASISTQMQNSGASSSAVAIGLLSFNKPSASGGASLANTTFSDCQNAKSKGMILLSSMALIASTANSLGAGAIANDCDSTSPSYNASTCQSTVQTQLCSTPAATLGSTAQAAYQQSCQGSNQQSSSVCLQYAQAMQGATTPTQIGQNLQQANGCP